MPAKNCTFSTESAHTSTMHGNTVITIKRIIFYLLHSLSSCLSICLSAFSSFFFTFPFPFHFFCFIFLLPFQFKFHFVSVSLFIFCLYGCLCFYTLYCSLSFSLCVYHICYFSISGRFISHGNKQRFQLKKKLSISTTQFEALVRAQLSKKEKPAELRILLRSLEQNKK